MSTRTSTKRIKLYNTEYSLVVTHLTTNPDLSSSFKGERTGSKVFRWTWSYVLEPVSCAPT